MSSKTVCDLCGNNLVKKRETIRLAVYADLAWYDYCQACFLDRKNWSKIYQVASQSMETKLDRLTGMNKKE